MLLNTGDVPHGKIVEIEGDVPVGMKLDINAFAEQIGTKIWERVGRANWRPFEAARRYVQTQGLRNAKHWAQFAKSESRPGDIPTNPHVVYRNSGWAGMGDWLGTGRLNNRNRKFRKFDLARGWVHALRLRSLADWKRLCRENGLPNDIPTNPNAVYAADGWRGFGDWFGTGTIAPRLRTFRDFASARAYARFLCLSTQQDWATFSKSQQRPADIPVHPDRTYRDEGWRGLGDWLGTTHRSKHQRTRFFEDARQHVRQLGLVSIRAWNALCKSGNLPIDIPRAPNAVYAGKGWISWSDWLGVSILPPRGRTYLPFVDARAYVRALELKSMAEWTKFSKSGRRPIDIPGNPNKVYRTSGWLGYGDWLGTGTVNPRVRHYRAFSEAREFARQQGLKSADEWRAWCKAGNLPDDIPATPYASYRGEWRGWANWLDSRSWTTFHRSFEDARAYVRSLALESKTAWEAYARSHARPPDIPATPAKVYHSEGWKGFGDWLGTATVQTQQRVYRDFSAARQFVHSHNLRSANAWRAFCKSGELPTDIPRAPNIVYSEWTDWWDWLGTTHPPSK